MKLLHIVTALFFGAAVLLGGCGTAATESVETTKTVTPNTTVIDKAEPTAELQEATKLLQTNDYAGTIAKADEILKKYPQSDAAYSLKGMAMGLNGNPADGLVLTKKAYELNPNNVSNYYNMDMLYKLQGQLTDAKFWFERVLTKDPKNTWSVYGIATIYADQGQDAKALQYLRQAVALDSAVKEAARTQDHFERFHGNSEFEAIVK